MCGDPMPYDGFVPPPTLLATVHSDGLIIASTVLRRGSCARSNGPGRAADQHAADPRTSMRVSDDRSLTSDSDDREPAAERPRPTESVPVADWQVQMLCKLLDALGLISPAQRRRAIEDVAGRSVQSLRDLSRDEAIRVLFHLAEPRCDRPE